MEIMLAAVEGLMMEVEEAEEDMLGGFRRGLHTRRRREQQAMRSRRVRTRRDAVRMAKRTTRSGWERAQDVDALCHPPASK